MYTLVIGRSFPSEETGMMGIFEFEQAAALKKYGMDTVYTFCDMRSVKRLRKVNYDYFNEKKVPVYGIHLPLGGMPRPLFNYIKAKMYKKLLKKIISIHGYPTCIHVHFPLLTLNKTIWKQLKDINVPIYCTEHWSKVQKKEISEYNRELLSEILNESKRFFTVGKTLKKSVLELTDTNKEITVFPNGVSSDFKNLNINKKNNKFRFIAIGRLVEEKQFDILIESFKVAFNNNNNVELFILGDGPEKNKLIKLVQHHNLHEKVVLKGFVSRDKIPLELNKADMYISTSRIETFGVPYVESLATGTPIIGKKNNMIEHIVSEINCGFVYDDISEIVSIMQKSFEDKDVYDRREISLSILKKYSQKSLTNKLLSIINEEGLYQ